MHAIRKKEGTTKEFNANHLAEAEAMKQRNTAEEARREAEEKAKLENKEWQEARLNQGIGIGRCDLCGSKKQELASTKIKDFFGEATRAVCFDCFCKYRSK